MNKVNRRLTRASVRSMELAPRLNSRDVFSAPTQLHPRCGVGPAGLAMANFCSASN